MIFGSNLLSSSSLSAIYSFLKHLHYRQRQAVVTVKIYNPGSDRLGVTHFLTLCNPCRDLYFGNHCNITTRVRCFRNRLRPHFPCRYINRRALPSEHRGRANRDASSHLRLMALRPLTAVFPLRWRRGTDEIIGWASEGDAREVGRPVAIHRAVVVEHVAEAVEGGDVDGQLFRQQSDGLATKRTKWNAE